MFQSIGWSLDGEMEKYPNNKTINPWLTFSPFHSRLGIDLWERFSISTSFLHWLHTTISHEVIRSTQKSKGKPIDSVLIAVGTELTRGRGWMEDSIQRRGFWPLYKEQLLRVFFRPWVVGKWKQPFEGGGGLQALCVKWRREIDIIIYVGINCYIT